MPYPVIRSRNSRSRHASNTAVAGLASGLALLSSFACIPHSHADDEAATAAATTTAVTPPGAAAYPAALQAKLQAALDARGQTYVPRTHHLLDDGRPRYTNRLILEDSPYLLQHAHNPVDWYSWGPEAFARARAEDKPIFLSIGYSTCHWCHVMERESFESEEIARILNEGFVSIKIDRERRPDIDDIYMTAVYLVNGRGGWPMSSFLTPEGKPIWGGTYFPPDHFKRLLGRVREGWQGDRENMLRAADNLAKAVADVTAARGEAQEVEGASEKAVAALLERHDDTHGGFGQAPKFPQEAILLFLLDRARRDRRPELRDALDTTLDAMARGGIYDQVGGGFHRYSTDAVWLAPHFEKMLYNQAHLARVYLAGWQLTGRDFYARVARQTLDYVLREMTSAEGAFYSATDADSEGEEGLFFLWTPAELRAALAEDDARLAIELFGVSEAGNFEHRNILHLPESLEAFAAERSLELTVLLERVDRIREALWQAREGREHPLRDDKILTAWNGMMITALVAGFETLGERHWLDAARRAAEFLWAKSHRGDGRLWRVYLGGRSSTPAVQDDHAFLAEALVALYDATGEAKWLERARQVSDAMLELFWDAEAGGFFLSAAQGDPHLIVRPKSPSDGAIPSGNSVAVVVLAQLAARTGDPPYAERARATVAAFSSQIRQSPSSYTYLLRGVDALADGEVGHRQYGAGGTVRAAASWTQNGGELGVRIRLAVRDGWHVNAHQPLQENLVPTVLTAGDGFALGELAYPEGRRVRLGFQDEPLLIYDGEVEITGRLSAAPKTAHNVPLRLRVQACNDEVCLRPEELVLEMPRSPP